MRQLAAPASVEQPFSLSGGGRAHAGPAAGQANCVASSQIRLQTNRQGATTSYALHDDAHRVPARMQRDGGSERRACAGM